VSLHALRPARSIAVPHAPEKTVEHAQRAKRRLIEEPGSEHSRRYRLKTLITYFTLTGNTEKIARAIYEEVLSQRHEAHLKPTAGITADSFAAYDLVLLGSACHDADLAKPVKRILEAITKSPSFKMAGFASHATPTPKGGERNRELYEEWAERCAESFERAAQEKEIELLGYFSCQGAPSPPIEAFIHSVIVTDEEEWVVYTAEARKHPNEEDLEQAREFARTVLSQSAATDT
jgi:flavodoxin I